MSRLLSSAAINTVMHVSFGIMVFCGYMPRSEIPRSYGSSIFSFSRNLHTVLHSGYINLHFHQQWRRITFCPHPFQHLLFVDFMMVAVLTDIRGYFIVVLICISLIISNVAFHVYMCPLEKCLFRYFADFLIGLFICLLTESCKSCLYIWENNPLLVTSFANVFSHSVGCIFILLMVSFALRELLSLSRSHLFLFLFSLL